MTNNNIREINYYVYIENQPCNTQAGTNKYLYLKDFKELSISLNTYLTRIDVFYNSYDYRFTALQNILNIEYRPGT